MQRAEKPEKRLSKKPLALISALILLASGLFVVLSNSGSDSSMTTKISAWLLDNGFCNETSEVQPLDGWEKDMKNIGHFNRCDDAGTLLEKRPGLSLELPYSWSGLSFKIASGDAKGKVNGLQSFTEKHLFVIEGVDWDVEVTTSELHYPGSYQEGKRVMKLLAEKFGGSLEPNYQPYDSCTSINEYLTTRSNEDPNFRPEDNDLAYVQACKKFFPESLQLNVWGS